MSGISYTSAFILGTLLECVLYGIFVSLFISACYIQWQRSLRGQRPNHLLAFATAFFGLTVTTNLAISLSVSMRAILYNPPGAVVHMPLDLQVSTRWITWFLTVQFQATVGDIIIIYRMYHIYDKNLFICIVPSMTTAASFVTGWGLVDQFRHPRAPSFHKKAGYWTICAFCLSIFNTVFLTVAISFRLWRVHRNTKKAGIDTVDSFILRTIKVLIESAALWTVFTAINFFAFLAKSNLVYTSMVMTSPAVGISFCLIIVRLGRILPQVQGEPWPTSIHTPALRISAPGRVAVSFPQVKIQREVYMSESEGFPMENLEIQKEGQVDSTDDSPKILRSSLSSDPA